ncbi:META domain-containing protein [Chlorogloeopsis sp. ULAP01]|uniref:META domain-containing protein n=1 Tax=Chlorogloeopsis sp. ULAP01 TaxID=3056483 RepID=UPI0025AB2C63|nr:META domain-containing protein [Chlorogloeopsis sp. ULAP01]MDM9380884.1 META domain-containing protein [Chlorogloeopsis sp. ULAP01]
MIYRSLVLTLFSVFAPLSVVLSASAQQSRTNNSWLDRPLVNWNRQGTDFPQLPTPSKTAGESASVSRCREQVRQPTSAAEKAVVKKGWTLYGSAQSFGTTTVFTAMSGVDGMCRPLGYQAFVYSEGRYAGTLSPVPMDSRTDSSLTNIRLNSATRIAGEFARYSKSDPLCCPSKTSTVQYSVRNDEVPDLTPVNVNTLATCQTKQTVEAGNNNNAASLFGKRWILTEIGEQRLSDNKLYIEFDNKQSRVVGDTGCNRFFGGFEINGTSLKFSPLASTKRACLTTEANRLETNFLRSLQETTRFDVQEKILRLYAGERQVLVFTSQ